MPRRERNYRAEYEARKARAAREGIPLRVARGHAPKGVPSLSQARKQAARQHVTPGEVIRRAEEHRAKYGQKLGKRNVPFKLPSAGGNIYTTGSKQRFRDLIRELAKQGETIAIRATFRDEHGNYKTRYIDKTTGMAGEAAATEAVASGRPGGRGGATAEGFPGPPETKVQVYTGPGVAAGGAGHQGVPARYLWFLIELYGDPWEALWELWTESYP